MRQALCGERRHVTTAERAGHKAGHAVCDRGAAKNGRAVAVLAALPAVLDGPLDKKRVAIADSLLAGLRMPVVRSPL